MPSSSLTLQRVQSTEDTLHRNAARLHGLLPVVLSHTQSKLQARPAASLCLPVIDSNACHKRLAQHLLSSRSSRQLGTSQA